MDTKVPEVTQKLKEEFGKLGNDKITFAQPTITLSPNYLINVPGNNLNCDLSPFFHFLSFLFCD